MARKRYEIYVTVKENHRNLLWWLPIKFWPTGGNSRRLKIGTNDIRMATRLGTEMKKDAEENSE